MRLIGSPGAAADAARWDGLLDDLGIRAAVSVEGAAPREAVAAAMRRAAIFVHPSPHETFGMVAAEALASGLPVAAAPSGGVDEIVGHDGRFGAVATATSVPALADAIDRALGVAPRADRAGMRAHVEERYAAPAVARATIDLYERTIIQTRARQRSDPAGSSDRGAAVAGGAFRLPVVLALARGQAIERVGALPLPLRDRLTVIKSPRGRYADDRDLPIWGDWLELEPESFYRDALAALERRGAESGVIGRLRAAITGQTLERAKRDLAARRDDVRQEGIAGFVRAATERVARPRTATGSIWLVALDADDLILADSLGPEIGRVAPGGLRWLADAWDAAGSPT